jgi:flagellar basal body-associated protein FliL
MQSNEQSDKTSNTLFMIFIGQIVLVVLAMIGYLIYSFFS